MNSLPKETKYIFRTQNKLWKKEVEATVVNIVPSRLPEIFMILAIIAAVFYLFLIHGVVKTDSENKKVVDERPPPAQPPKPSNEGQRPVCSSHAIAKALVDILDGLGYDCDQQDIIDKLGKSI